MTTSGAVYDFVFRGLLTEEALDNAGRTNGLTVAKAAIVESLNYPLLDPELLEHATTMGIVYAAIATFENAARLFITKVLLDAHGANWWGTQVSDKVKKAAQTRRDDEERTKWHGKRGDSLLNYTEMGQLVDIMRQNWTDFEPHVPRIEWAESIFDTIERSRNVIMHSGLLEMEDIERVGINIRDWTKQVGA